MPASLRDGLADPLGAITTARAETAASLPGWPPGAAAVEAYPWPGGAGYRYMGTRDLYLGAGFRDVPVPAGCRSVICRPLRG